MNFAVVSFGTDKKDYFLCVSKKPLAKNPVFSLEYIAIIDVFLLLGIVLWLMGYAVGLHMTVFVILVAILLFVNERQADKKLRIIEKILGTFWSTGKWKTDSLIRRHPRRSVHSNKHNVQ